MKSTTILFNFNTAYMKNPFISFVALFSFLLISLKLPAQNRQDKIESIKIAYLSQRLHLDPPTAEKFWPVYNQYEEEIRKARKALREENRSTSVEEQLDKEQELLNIRKRYSTLFLKVISGDQLQELYAAEKDFNRILMRRADRLEERRKHPDGFQENRPKNRNGFHPSSDKQNAGERQD